MRLHDAVEWHEDKAKANLHKYRIRLTDAAAVLTDPDGDRFHLESYDEAHSEEEDRTITIGSHPQDRGTVLYIAWTDRSERGRQVTRIISARKATARERRDYEQWLFGAG